MKTISAKKMGAIIKRLRESHAVGKWPNLITNALFAVGNGTSNDARKNAFEVHDRSIVVGGQTLSADTIRDIATKGYIEDYIDSLGVAEGVAF